MILNLMGVIPTFYLISNFKKLKFHAAAWMMSYSFLMSLVQVIIAKGFGMRNWWTIVLWTIGAVMIMTISSKQLTKNKGLERFLFLFGSASTLTLIVAYLTVYHWQYNIYFATLLSNIYFIILSVIVFFDLALYSSKDNLLDEPSYWYHSGLILFASVIIFRDLQPPSLVQDTYGIIQGGSYLIMCITFTIGMHKWKIQDQS